MAGSPSRRPRSGSDGDEVANVNVNWVTASPALWFFYLFCLVVFRIAIYPTPLTVAWSWTFTVIVHGLVRTGWSLLQPRHGVLTQSGAFVILSSLRNTHTHTHHTRTTCSQQIQFFGLHWAKGTAIWWDQGAHRDETFWEQLDGGVPWTSSKKILLIIPVALYDACCCCCCMPCYHIATNTKSLLFSPPLPAAFCGHHMPRTMKCHTLQSMASSRLCLSLASCQRCTGCESLASTRHQALKNSKRTNKKRSSHD